MVRKEELLQYIGVLCDFELLREGLLLFSQYFHSVRAKYTRRSRAA